MALTIDELRCPQNHPNTCIAIRFQYLNAKGELISTFGVLQIVSIENIGTNNEIITFNYIYKPQTY